MKNEMFLGGETISIDTSGSTVSLQSLQNNNNNDQDDLLDKDIMMMTSPQSERMPMGATTTSSYDHFNRQRISIQHRALSRLFDSSSSSRLQPGTYILS